MSKIKILIGFALMLAALAVSAAPAAAQFASNNGTSENKAKPAGKALATSVLTITGGTLECEAANAKIDSWQILDTKLAKTTKGPNENVTISCPNGKAKVGIFTVAASLEPCTLRVNQPNAGEKTGLTGSVVSECVVKIPAASCEVKVGTTNNQGLKTVTADKNGSGNTELKANVTGITDNTNCIGTTSGNNATFVTTAELVEQKVV